VLTQPKPPVRFEIIDWEGGGWVQNRMGGIAKGYSD
jgi:hypothetical protein